MIKHDAIIESTGEVVELVTRFEEYKEVFYVVKSQTELRCKHWNQGPSLIIEEPFIQYEYRVVHESCLRLKPKKHA